MANKIYYFLLTALICASCGGSKKTTAREGLSPETSAQRELYGGKQQTQTVSAKALRAPYRPLRKKQLKIKYASMLEVPVRKIKDKKLYYFIDEWWGTRYQWGGNDLDGADCSGFVQQLYNRVYGTRIVRTSIDQYEHSRSFKRKRRFREGDLVFFHTTGEKVSHVGVYLRNSYFVHVSTGKGVMISNLNESFWKKCFTGGGKMRKE